MLVNQATNEAYKLYPGHEINKISPNTDIRSRINHNANNNKRKNKAWLPALSENSYFNFLPCSLRQIHLQKNIKKKTYKFFLKKNSFFTTKISNQNSRSPYSSSQLLVVVFRIKIKPEMRLHRLHKLSIRRLPDQSYTSRNIILLFVLPELLDLQEPLGPPAVSLKRQRGLAGLRLCRGRWINGGRHISLVLVFLNEDSFSRSRSYCKLRVGFPGQNRST